MKEAKEAPPRMALRLNEAAQTLGLSRRTIERLRSAGVFPRPDAVVGRAPLWRPSTLETWLASQSKN